MKRLVRSKASVIRSLFFFSLLVASAACAPQNAPAPLPAPSPTTRVVVVVATNPPPTATAPITRSPTVPPSNTPIAALMNQVTPTSPPTRLPPTRVLATQTALPPTRAPTTPTDIPTERLDTPTLPTPAPTLAPTEAATNTPSIPPPAAFQATELVTIPDGVLQMGSRNEEGAPDQHPLHDVPMGAYSIERFEVTNAQYDACVRAGACAPGGERVNGANYPVVNVTWIQADAYCKWIGRRLPNEAEWERAGKGVDNWRYSWSNDFGMAFEWNAIFHGAPLSFCEASCPLPHSIDDVNDGFATSAPVGSFGGTNPRQDVSKGFDVYDMNGNVREWVSNWYDPTAYQQGYPVDVFGPQNATGSKVVRGSSWATEPMPLANRMSLPPDQSRNDIGFRCAQ